VTNPSFDSDFSYPESIQQYPRSSEILGWPADRARVWQDQTTKPDGFDASFPNTNSRQRTAETCRTVKQRHSQVNLFNNIMRGTIGSNKMTAGCIVTTDAERAIMDKSKCVRYAANVRPANTKRLREEGMGNNSAESDGVESRFGDEKKKYREKNRLTAARCRLKKKGNNEDIVMKHHKLSIMNSILKKQVQDLHSELTDLRTHALNHQDCKCPVTQYNINHARTFAQVEAPTLSMGFYGSGEGFPYIRSVPGGGDIPSILSTPRSPDFTFSSITMLDKAGQRAYTFTWCPV
jgi:hypothetical protein